MVLRSRDSRWGSAGIVIAALIAVALGMAAVGVWALVPGLRAGVHEPSRSSRTGSPSGPLGAGLGLYAGAVRKADGRIDSRATIAAVKRVGGNRYYYLIWDRAHPGEPEGAQPAQVISQRAWDDLPGFAVEAKAHGVDVVVYLVPPTESNSSTYRPFGWDYERWGREIGALAKRHPNIQGWAIDDFGANTDYRPVKDGLRRFTQDDVRRWRDASRSHAPWLKLYAVMYGQDFYGRTATLARFRTVLDGVIYPFAGPDQMRHAPQNTIDAHGAGSTTRDIRGLTECAGSQRCWQLRVDPPMRTSVPAAREATVRGHIQAPAGRRLLQLAVRDDRDARYSDEYDIVVRIDGRPVALKPVRDLSRGWKQLEGPVEVNTSGDHELELSIKTRLTTRVVTALVSDVRVQAGVVPPPDEAWRYETTPGVAVDVVGKLDLVFMAYASRFGMEKALPGAADAAYLTDVLGQVHEVVRTREVDGVVIYRLNVTGRREVPLMGDPANVEVVAKALRAMRSAAG